MFLSAFLFLVALILLLLGFCLVGDNILVSLFLFACAISIVLFTCSNHYLAEQRYQSDAETQQKEAACRVPQLVASVDGVELWKYKSGCNDRYPVYFSKSGTSQEVCHREGKHHSCKTITTPNSN